MRVNFAALAAAILTTATIFTSASMAQATPTYEIYLDSSTQLDVSYNTMPYDLTVIGTKLFFIQGGKLKVYDSVAHTTTQILAGATIPRGPFGVANGKLIFNAYVSSDPGQEVYMSDGTTAGTGLLKDILPGSAQSQPGNFMQFGNVVIFSTRNAGNTAYELWKTDGTPNGTVKIRDINYLIGSYGNAVLNGKLYFQAADPGYALTIWATDGVTASQVSNITPDESNLTTFGGWVYFNGDATSAAISNRSGSITGNELLRTNGTITEIAADVNPTTNNSSWSKPTNLAVIGGSLYFSADDGVHGRELMKFDGQTTTLIKDQYVGLGSSSPWHITGYNGKIYYSALDSTNSRELYVSDGTDAGTDLLADIYPGSTTCQMFIDPGCFSSTPRVNTSDPQQFTAFDGHLLFSALEPTYGAEIFSIYESPAPTPTPTVTVAVPKPGMDPLLAKRSANAMIAMRGAVQSAGAPVKYFLSADAFENLSAATVDGKIAKISRSASGAYEISVDGDVANNGDVVLTTEFGKMTLVSAVQIAAVAPTVSLQLGRAANSNLTEKAKTYLVYELSKNLKATSATCQSAISGTASAAKVKTTKQQLARVCAYVQSLRPSLQVSAPTIIRGSAIGVFEAKLDISFKR